MFGNFAEKSSAFSATNTAEGTSALFSLTSGIDNTGLGFQALFHNTTGRYNSGIGYLALISSLGYFVTIFLLIITVALYAGARLSLKLLAISVVGAISMWVIFDKLFSIPLPVGSLWQGLFN